MKRRIALSLGFGAYALALLATAPATFVDAALQRASEGRLRLAEAQGTLWSGAGLLEIRDARGQSGIAREIAWRVVPQSLLRARIVCDVKLERASRRFPVTLSMSGLELANAELDVPAAALGLAMPRLAPLGLTGEVLIHVASLAITRDAVVGEAIMRWRAAGSTLTPVSPLGNYELRIDGEGRTARAVLRTVAGPLQLDGKGSWTKGAKPVFLATIHVLPRHQEQLAPLLRLVAVEHGPGNFELSSGSAAFGS